MREDDYGMVTEVQRRLAFKYRTFKTTSIDLTSPLQ